MIDYPSFVDWATKSPSRMFKIEFSWKWADLSVYETQKTIHNCQTVEEVWVYDYEMEVGQFVTRAEDIDLLAVWEKEKQANVRKNLLLAGLTEDLVEDTLQKIKAKFAAKKLDLPDEDTPRGFPF